MHNCDSVTQKGPRGFVVAGVTDPVDTIEPTLVLNGQPLSTAIGTLPEVVNTGYKLKHWVVIEGGIAGTTEITINSVITQPSIEVSAIWEEDAPHVHNWEFDTLSENVTWIGNDTDGYDFASIKKTCKSCHRSVSVSVKTTLSVDGIAWSKDAVRHYTAVFDSSVDKDIDGTFTYTKTVSGPYEKHIWKVDSVTSNGSFEVAPTEAYLNLVCEREASHLETVSASKIELLSSNELSKEYQYTGTSSDGQTVSGTQEFFDHTEHKWNVLFDWKQVSSNKADTIVTAEATCKVGGEKKSLEVTLDDKQVGSKIEYTAKATVRPEKCGPAKRILIPRHAR